MSNRLALVSLIGLLAGLLALILTGAVRETIVVPLLFLLWLARVLFESLPQAGLWGVLLVIAALLAWKSMAGAPSPLPPRRPAPIIPTPVESWAGMFQRAATDHYARWLLAQRLGQLMLEQLARQEQHAARGAWQYLEADSSDIPPDVRAYLRAGRRAYRPRPRRWWLLATRPAANDPLDLDPELVIRFFETRLNR